MTTLTKPVRRKVTTLRGEVLMLTLLPEGIEFREPRRRTKYVLPYGDAFLRAARLAADAALADKPKRKTRVKRGSLHL